MSVLDLKRSIEIDGGHYVGDDLPFFCYDIETVDLSDNVATRVPKRLRVIGMAVLNVPGYKVACLKLTSYASIESCELDCKRCYGEIEEKKVPDDNIMDTDSLNFSLQRDAGWNQDIGVLDD